MKSTEKEQFFSSATAFRQWLMKNHSKKDDIWVGLYKKSYNMGGLTMNEAIDQCHCFGWVLTITKRIDLQKYKIRFVRRSKKSPWSQKSVERFLWLRKQKLTHESGEKAFKNRDKEKSEKKHYSFSPKQLKEFKKNKKAWDFFNTQTDSYKKYMIQWVTTAKRQETQEKRLSELIQDSSEESKLKRVLKAVEKTKPKYEPGKTPIEVAKNIGPASGVELRSVGIDTVEKLQKMGWEEAFIKLCETHPHRLNLNMLTALIGAVEDQKWNQLEPQLKAEAKQFLRSIKREFEELY